MKLFLQVRDPRWLPFAIGMLAVAWCGLLAATPLDDYVAAPDASYSFGPEPAKTIAGDGFQATVWRMTSQTWLDQTKIDRPLWEHWLVVVEPAVCEKDLAMVFIGGGRNRPDPPESVDAALGRIAVTTKSILAEVRAIPNQPLKFPDETDSRYMEKGRVEDEFIAYTWDKFMVTGDPQWPARLPMTKAVVRAMDTLQKLHPTLKGFVVAGGSKRGWTTWTTAAVDKRVVAIVPAVIDLLNVEHSMQHHFDAYGFWAPAIQEYQDLRVLDRIHTPEFRALMKIVDPYWYRDRLTMPKYIVCSTGDQFFLPDSSQFYFDAIKGPKYLRYVPNTDHGLSLEAYMNLAAFYDAILNQRTLPEFSWEFDPKGSLRVEVRGAMKPAAVRHWQATNPDARDFRLETLGKAWTSAPLEMGDDGTCVAPTPAPEKGWSAHMVELEYPVDGALPLKFTTEVVVMPPTLPFRKPGGSGVRETIGEGKDAITVVRLSGDRYQMGYWYGKLLADSIAAAWQGLMADIQVSEAEFDHAVEALWQDAWFDTMAWEAELRGMADGCTDAGRPEITCRLLQRMLAVADMSENGCSLFAAWGKATRNGDLYQLRNLDWSMTTGLQDHPVIAVYTPTDGLPHAVIGFAGIMGATVGGLNAAGLGVSEIMGHFGDAETLEGIPFPVLLRDVLYHDTTLEQAIGRMRKATRTNQYYYAIADPAAPDPKARLLFTSHSRFDEFTDDKTVIQHPCIEPAPFHKPLDDVIYWKRHDGGGNKQVYKAIRERYGAIDGAKAREIARVAGVNGTLVSIVYHNTARECWVAYAEGKEPAHKRPYVRFQLAAPESPRSEEQARRVAARLVIWDNDLVSACSSGG